MKSLCSCFIFLLVLVFPAHAQTSEKTQIDLLIELVDVLKKDNQRLKVLADAWQGFHAACSSTVALQPLDAALSEKMKKAEQACLQSKGKWNKETLSCVVER
jgi:hypothetical protein